MSNKIGDYIHLKNENYVNYGLTRNNPDGKAQYDNRKNVLQEQVNNIKIFSTTQNKIQGLETFLNNLLYPKNEKSQVNIDEQVFQQFEATVQQLFKEKAPNLKIDLRDIHVYNPKKQIQDNISVSQLQSYGIQLQETIEKMSDQDIEISVDKIKQIIDQIQQIVNQNNPDSKIVLSEIDPELRNSINKALGLGSYSKKTLGDAFEIWLSAVSELGKYYVEQQTNNILDNFTSNVKENTTSGLTSESMIKLDKINSEFADKKQVSDYLKSQKWSISENLDVAYHNSQQKSDLVFNWKGNNLYVSAKNYKLGDKSQKIHLLSKTTLLQVLVNCSSSYANHYLNIVGTKDNALQEAHDSLKTILLATALTGQELKNKGLADTFIINARQKRHIYIFTMKQLFNHYKNNLDGIRLDGDIKISNDMVNPGTNSYIFAKQRITNLLIQAHASKLSLTINQSILTK